MSDPNLSGETTPSGDKEMHFGVFVGGELVELGVVTADGSTLIDSDGINPAKWIEPVSGTSLEDYWDTIGLDKGDYGFYNQIRINGCTDCGSHTPGCCDGCA